MSFLDETAFNVGGNDFGRTSLNLNTGRYGNSRPSTSSTQRCSSRDVEETENFSNNVANAGMSSRARMLAQQRELQLKRRQNAMQNGGMIRSSIDNISGVNPMKLSSDGQFTPSIRQFSAPKSVREDDDDEYVRPNSRSVATSGSNNGRRFFEDDDDDDTKPYVPRRNASAKGSRKNDDFDDGEGETYHGYNSNTNRSTKPNRHIYDDDDEDDEDDRYERRPGNSRRLDKSRDNRQGRNFDNEEPVEEETYSYRKNGNRGSNANNSGSSKPRRSSTSSTQGNGRSQYVAGHFDGEEDDDDRDDNEDRWRGGDRDSATKYNDARLRGSNRDSLLRKDPRDELDSIPGAYLVRSPQPLDLSNMKSFLMNPVPKASGVVQCYIRRNKSGTNKLFPIYSLYLKNGDRFLMVSRKRPNNKTSNYLISMGENDLARDGGNYLGKLRSNFVGTEFQIYDNGCNPKETEAGEETSGEIRRELGAVIYAANVLGSRGPRKMQVAIPTVDADCNAAVWKPTGNGDDMLSRIKERTFHDLSVLINKPPRWNEQVGAYVLNFNGRVTMASVKNFQLVDPDDQNEVVLQFGRVGKDEFTMDLQWPMSPFQAFAVTLSSFDSKIACD